MVQAIVTGGAVRIGRAISLALADAGYDIILVFHNSFEEAREVSSLVEAKGRRCYLHKCDISRKENIDNLFVDITRKYDDVRLLVNSAAIFGKYSFHETSEQLYDTHMNINLKAPFFIAQNYVQYLGKRAHIANPHIVNIVDKKTEGVNTGHFIYHISKLGLLDLTMALAKDLAPKVRVNAISPASILPSNHFELGKKQHQHLELTDEAKKALKLLTDKLIELDKATDSTGKNVVVDIA
jgi:pteridine reductase